MATRNSPDLLIVKTGSTIDPRRRGDFEHWFTAGVGLGPERVQVVDVQRGEPLPGPREHRGIIITGAPEMVTDRAPWSQRVARWLPSVVEAGTPLLGVCYGHQLLAQALGGEVGPNPLGLEMGTVSTRLTPEASQDPLFLGFPRTLTVQATHFESVLRLPPGAHRLAAGDCDPNHAFAVGRAAWGVQFHPEFDADITRNYLHHRRQWVTELGQDPDALAASTADSPHGRLLLERFAQVMAQPPSDKVNGTG